MSKKLTLVFAIIIFFSKFGFVFADVVISELAWKGTPTGSTHEWLELHNTGPDEDISGWIIKDGESQLNITIPAGTTIASGGFYVIKRTTSDISPYNFSTAFNGGLSDSGETLIITNDSNIEQHTLDFSGGWPNPAMTADNTMQLVNGSWVSATPTPGQANSPSDFVSENNDDSSSAISPNVSGSNIVSTPISSKVKTEVSVRNIAYVGIPLSFQGKATQGGQRLSHGRYFWNFGDGDFREVKAINADRFSHTYFYPGEYAVIFEYYPDHFAEEPDASEKINIKVIDPKISVSRVGNERDFFVELSNNTGYDVDLSNWILLGNGKSFTIPKNTIIAAKKTMIIAGKVSNFSIYDKTGLKLATPEGEIMFEYFTYAAPAYPKTSSFDKREEENNMPRGAVNEGEFPAKGLLSLATEVDLAAIEGAESFFIIILSTIFIGGAATAVYRIRRKKTALGSGEDFEILDE